LGLVSAFASGIQSQLVSCGLSQSGLLIATTGFINARFLLSVVGGAVGGGDGDGAIPSLPLVSYTENLTSSIYWSGLFDGTISINNATSCTAVGAKSIT